MDFPPEHYFQTSPQRMRQAYALYREGESYALAMYVGGVAVECLLRAFKGRRGDAFDEKHDLLKLFLGSGMLHIDVALLHEHGWSDDDIDRHLNSLRASINEVYSLWRNDFRYASEERVAAHLKKVKCTPKIKGDQLKEQARRFLNAAQNILDRGAVLWHA